MYIYLYVYNVIKTTENHLVLLNTFKLIAYTIWNMRDTYIFVNYVLFFVYIYIYMYLVLYPGNSTHTHGREVEFSTQTLSKVRDCLPYFRSPMLCSFTDRLLLTDDSKSLLRMYVLNLK